MAKSIVFHVFDLRMIFFLAVTKERSPVTTPQPIATRLVAKDARPCQSQVTTTMPSN